MSGVAKKRRPILCRLGMHQYYMDSACFSQALRCSGCSHYAYPDQQEKLEYERTLWDQHSDEPLRKARIIIAEKMKQFRPTRTTTSN